MIQSLFSFFALFLLPLLIAGYIAYRIKVELETGRSHMRGIWSERTTEPRMFWFDIGLKAFGVAVFLYLPLSTLWISLGAFAK